jgi:hypothetical protein
MSAATSTTARDDLLDCLDSAVHALNRSGFYHDPATVRRLSNERLEQYAICLADGLICQPNQPCLRATLYRALHHWLTSLPGTS